MINLYNADCFPGLKKMPDKCYELAIIDVPYGIGEDGKKNHSRGSVTKFKYKGTNITRKNNAMQKPKLYKPYHGNDKNPPTKEYFSELFRVSKNQIIWGANHFIENLPKQNSSCWIVWDKENGESDFADCELAWTSFKTAVRKFTFMWNGMLQGDMANKQIRLHPNEKPIALYKWLLKNYAKPGDKILDTHAGSFSIGIACYDMGFDLDAYEIDTDYYNLALERFNKHKFIQENKKSADCYTNDLALFGGGND